MLLDIFDVVVGGINTAAQALGISWIAIIMLALLLVTTIISFCATIFSSELKTARAVEKLNAYLESNPFINDENLVEFNKLMKKIPAPMRAQWQQYMINRDKKPSEFFTEDKCIEKPFKASGYKNHITAVRTIIICLAILSFVFSVGAIADTTSTLAIVLVESLLLPLVVVFLGELYLLFLKARRNSSIADVYGIFTNFQHAIDRAVTTLPDYVDYEILFTRKEIVSGIPVLQQYLQQRALFEQEQIRKAKESQVEHEDYDFSSLGVNGSLIMERAMRECEYYLGNRKRVLAEISELQGSRDLLEKSYEEKNKTSQRKLRDIQESLDRLKEKLDNTTNIIVGNDLRKQRENEIQKQRQLEKEIEEDNNKYDADRKALEKQIDEKKAEIEGFRKTAESSLNGEFKTYADKIYAEIKAIIDAETSEEINSIKLSNQDLQVAIEERDKAIAEKAVIYDEKLAVIEEYANRIAEQEQLIAELQAATTDVDSEINSREKQIESKDKEIFDINKTLESRKLEIEKKNKEIETLKQTIKDIKRKKQVEVYRYFDANGNEFFVDENGNPYYSDENGNPVYAENAEPAPEANANVAPEATAEYEEVSAETLNLDEQLAEDEVVLKPEQPAEPEVLPQQEVSAEPEQVKPEQAELEQPVEFENIEQQNIEPENVEPVKEQPAEPTELSSEEIDKLIADIEEKMANKDESKKAKPQPQEPVVKKPVFDFIWENSNSPEKFEKEPEEKPAEKVEEKQPEQAEPAQDIESIEKEIENQNAELDKQTKNLSAQLEETKAIAESKPKAKKPAAKKSTAKKPAARQQKKPTAKKTTTKKATTKKAESKKVEKPASKKAAASKTATKKAKTKKPVAKKTKPTGNGDDITVGDLSLMEFNEQLKSVLKEINESDSK